MLPERITEDQATIIEKLSTLNLLIYYEVQKKRVDGVTYIKLVRKTRNHTFPKVLLDIRYSIRIGNDFYYRPSQKAKEWIDLPFSQWEQQRQNLLEHLGGY